jgi:hypothetical protein
VSTTVIIPYNKLVITPTTCFNIKSSHIFFIWCTYAFRLILE